MDPEADRLIAELFARHPEARYRITQSAFVQEAALVEANNRIRQLEWEVENAHRQAQAQAAQRQGGGGGVFGGLFGGGRPGLPMPPPMPPRPQPQYPQGYDPRALARQDRGGMGFLGTAVSAAAGVAGGMLIGNLLMNAFGGGHGAAQAASPFATGGADATPAASPWGAPDAAPQDDGARPTVDDDDWGQDAQAMDDGEDWGGGEEI